MTMLDYTGESKQSYKTPCIAIQCFCLMRVQQQVPYRT